MATFSIMNSLNKIQHVEAEKFVEEGSFVVFRDGSGAQIYAIPTAHVKTIKRGAE
ncbi:hypothetical protein P9990_19840 [Prescottella equi]|uniref:hypothetical protein n=1 Tax=Rhodococcus hoagii TaxID=43767 RepID=UPI0025779B2F|nr:hypothetical protein [Prescottella equi]WJJ10807.1 hypothetical protein P9990_19840 [Prescottella equi]